MHWPQAALVGAAYLGDGVEVLCAPHTATLSAEHYKMRQDGGVLQSG